MGYYTSYILTAKNLTKEEYDKINQILIDKNLIGPARSGCVFEAGEYVEKESYAIWYPCDLAIWYDSDEDMKNIAVMFPNTKFMLKCWCEDNEEWADFFYKDMHDYVSRPDFDPKPVSFEW